MSSEKYLVDTTVWVGFLRGLDEDLKERISPLVIEDRVYICEIIIMEILRGAKSEKEYKMLYQDFLSLPQLRMDHVIWERSWELAYKLRKKGVNAPIADVMIAAVALENGCTLISADKHFDAIAKITGQKVLQM